MKEFDFVFATPLNRWQREREKSKRLPFRKAVRHIHSVATLTHTPHLKCSKQQKVVKELIKDRGQVT